MEPPSPQPMPKTNRIEARVDPETQALLKRAAELQGRSLSDFVVSAARDAALETIAARETLQLSCEAQAMFVSRLLEPGPPRPALKRAADHHARLIGSCDDTSMK